MPARADDLFEESGLIDASPYNNLRGMPLPGKKFFCEMVSVFLPDKLGGSMLARRGPRKLRPCQAQLK